MGNAAPGAPRDRTTLATLKQWAVPVAQVRALTYSVEVFTPIGSRQAFHEVGRKSWGHGPNRAPPQVTGVDVVRVRDGRIAALYPFVDVPASGPG